MSNTTRKMKKADLLACVEITLDYLCLDDIESPEHLREELEVQGNASGRMLIKALEGIQTMEQLEETKRRLNPGPKKRKATKEKKYAFIKDQANKELEKNPKLSKIEAKRRANEKMPAALNCGKYGEEELKKIKL